MNKLDKLYLHLGLKLEDDGEIHRDLERASEGKDGELQYLFNYIYNVNERVDKLVKFLKLKETRKGTGRIGKYGMRKQTIEFRKKKRKKK